MFNKLHIFIRIPCQQSSIIYLWNISAGSVCRSLIVEAGTERKTRLWQQQPPHNTTSNVVSRLVSWRCSGLPPCLLTYKPTEQPSTPYRPPLYFFSKNKPRKNKKGADKEKMVRNATWCQGKLLNFKKKIVQCVLPATFLPSILLCLNKQFPVGFHSKPTTTDQATTVPPPSAFHRQT